MGAYVQVYLVLEYVDGDLRQPPHAHAHVVLQHKPTPPHPHTPKDAHPQLQRPEWAGDSSGAKAMAPQDTAVMHHRTQL